MGSSRQEQSHSLTGSAGAVSPGGQQAALASPPQPSERDRTAQMYQMGVPGLPNLSQNPLQPPPKWRPDLPGPPTRNSNGQMGAPKLPPHLAQPALPQLNPSPMAQGEVTSFTISTEHLIWASFSNNWTLAQCLRMKPHTVRPRRDPPPPPLSRHYPNAGQLLLFLPARTACGIRSTECFVSRPEGACCQGEAKCFCQSKGWHLRQPHLGVTN